jgi:hypothetical protein
MLVYVAGPYIAYNADGTHDPIGIQANIDKAEAVQKALLRMGHAVICPHKNTAHLDALPLTHDQWIAMDLQMLVYCQAMVVLPNFQSSKGTAMEIEFAERVGIPIYYLSEDWKTEADPCLPAMHPTEVRCPEQAKAFREIVGRMYRVHLKKNADYSNMNIAMTGEIGLVTRIWDKVSRLLNLTGFRAKVEFLGFDAPKVAQNEPIDDSYLDAGVYSVIGMLYRMGVWGR